MQWFVQAIAARGDARQRILCFQRRLDKAYRLSFNLNWNLAHRLCTRGGRRGFFVQVCLLLCMHTLLWVKKDAPSASTSKDAHQKANLALLAVVRTEPRRSLARVITRFQTLSKLEEREKESERARARARDSEVKRVSSATPSFVFFFDYTRVLQIFIRYANPNPAFVVVRPY